MYSNGNRLRGDRQPSDDEDDLMSTPNSSGFASRPSNNNEDADCEEQGFEKREEVADEIFTFKTVDLPGVPKQDKIKKLFAAEEARIILTENNKLYRWRIRIDQGYIPFDMPDAPKENFLGMLSRDKSSNIKAVFMDRKGYHCILISDTGITFYLNFRDSKVRTLKQLKGLQIKTIAFHNDSTENKSGDIILCLQNGVIVLYRLQIVQNELQEAVILQFSLSLSSQICSVEILRLTQANNQKYVMILFCTIGSISCITGADDLSLVLSGYKNQTERLVERQMTRGFQCLTHLCFSKLNNRPSTLFWTNGLALTAFRIPDKDEPLSDTFLLKPEHFRFAKKTDQPPEKAFQLTEYPIAVGITDFHYYLLFQDSITIMSRITQRLVLYEQFKGFLMSDMCYERSESTFWLHSPRGVLKLNTSREGTQAWKLLLLERKYEQAYQVCKIKGENVPYIAGLYADELFAGKRYQKAAELYKETQRSFEQIFLKFLLANSDQANEGLDSYLKYWLARQPPENKSQRMMLISWLVELCSYKLNLLDKERAADERRLPQIKKKLKEKQHDMEKLLEENISILNEELIYLIMQSQGRIQNLIDFADRKSNYEMIVMHYLSDEKYDKALEYLKNVKDPKMVDVVYKYAHIFFRYEPEKTASLLTKSIKEFKPIKLMPGLMNIPEDKRVAGIELLKYSVQELRSREKSLHNMLIFFYATAPKEKTPQLLELMRKDKLEFDLDYGLRLFKQYRNIEAQIIVYGKMDLYSQAVSLALSYSKEELAKQFAEKPFSDDQRKKLWIEIAKYYLASKAKISQVIELTRQSKIIKIEDLLPYFNENIKIENFKDQICASLKSYSQEISVLKRQMDCFSENAKQLKDQLRMIRNRAIEIDANHKCEQCFRVLFGEQFYIFPCMHGFHRHCLQGCVKSEPTFNKLKLDRIELLSAEIQSLSQRVARRRAQVRAEPQNAGTSGFSLRSALSLLSAPSGMRSGTEAALNQQELEKETNELKRKKDELDAILASECIYCGPGLVETITMPFEDEALKDSWRV